MQTEFGGLILYTSKTQDMISFYGQLFGYQAYISEGDRIVELRPTGPGVPLLLHPIARGVRQGQATVKLVFSSHDVASFCTDAKDKGFDFSALHHGDGYVFANAKDPAGNSVSVSGRFLRKS